MRSNLVVTHVACAVIYPLDYEQNSHIVDDLMHDIMVRPLPPGCRMTAIFDVRLLHDLNTPVTDRLCLVMSFWHSSWLVDS